MIGSLIGRFEILDQLGQGGMGVVWKARDTTLNRIVALKLLRIRTLDDGEPFQQLIREARLASSLNHPHIVTIYEVGNHEGTVYIAMEWVDGVTLQRIIPNTGLPVDEVLRIASQIADALAAAHGAGLIHCDLKPSNILVNTAGQVKLVDFGLARLHPKYSQTGEDDSVTSFTKLTEAVTGTPAYMSPEQIMGRSLDSRSDLFSLGTVLYQALSGRAAFRGKAPAMTMAAVAHDEPSPLHNIPHEVERIIMRLLRKEPERRWQTAVDLKAALDDLREETSTQKLKPIRDSRRKRRIWPWAVLASALAGAAWIYWRSQDHAPFSEPVVSQFTTVPGIQRSPSFSVDGNQLAHSWNGGSLGNFDIYVRAISGGDSLRLTTDPAIDEAPVWSPTGERIAFIRAWTLQHKSIFIIGPLGGAERKVYDLPQTPRVDQPSEFCWTIDGKYLIVSERADPDGVSELKIVSADTGEVKPISSKSRFFGNTPSLSPDGHRLAVIRPEEKYRLWAASFDMQTLQAGEPSPAILDMRPLDSPAWTSNSAEIIVTDNSTGSENRLFRIDVDSPGTLRPVEYSGTPADSAVISTHSDRMAFTRTFNDSNIWKLNLDASRNVIGKAEPLIASTFLELQPTWSANGQFIAFESTRSGYSRVWIAQANGTPLFQLGSGNERTGSPAFSSDGKWIAYDTLHPNQNVFISPANGGQGRALPGGESHRYSPSWSRDSRSLYVNEGLPPDVTFLRIPAEGGATRQITSHVGRYPRESIDGKNIYFEASTGQQFSEIWQVPASGGEAKLVLPRVFARSWDLDESGIWYIIHNTNNNASLEYFDFAQQTVRTIYRFPFPPMRGLAVSPDRRTVLFVQVDGQGSNIMLMEHFR